MRRTLAAAVAGALGVAALPVVAASGATSNYVGPAAGAWGTSTHWDPQGVPGAGDAAQILHSDAIGRTITLDVAATVDTLRIGNTGAGGSTTLTQTGATAFDLSAVGEEIGFGIDATAVHDHTIGTNTYSRFLSVGAGSGAAGSGTYNLGGTATLLVTGTDIGGPSMTIGVEQAGTFNHTGGIATIGTNTASVDLLMGLGAAGVGTYNLANAAATLRVHGTQYVGYNGAGHVAHSAGGSTVDALSVGHFGSGAYALSGAGTLAAKTLDVGRFGAGTFTQTGGTVTVSGGAGLRLAASALATGNATFTLSAGSFTTNLAHVGGGTEPQPGGKGLLNIQGGAMSVTGLLKVWDSPNTAVNVTGGTLTAGSIELTGATFNAAATGAVVTPTFTQEGGSFTGVADISAAGIASYILNEGVFSAGGTLAAGGMITLGGDGPIFSPATFTQTGGGYFMQATGFSPSFAPGTYHLNGGTFSAEQGFVVGRHPLPQTFNVAGGTLHIDDGDFVVGNAAAGTLNHTAGSVQADGAVRIGRTTEHGTGAGTYVLGGAASTFTVAGDEWIGTDSATVNGTFTQSAGTHTVGGVLAIGQFGVSQGVANGSYALSGGTLAVAGNVAIGGSFAAEGDGHGVFTHTGGGVTVGTAQTPATLNLGYLAPGETPESSATYTMSGATSTLTVNGGAYVGGYFNSGGGKGVLDLQAGTIDIAGQFKLWDSLAGASSVTLGGGSFSAAGGIVMLGGTFTRNAAAALVAPTVTQDGGTFTGVADLATGQIGTYTQTGGSFTATGTLAAGGKYVLDGSGTFAAPTFTQQGGAFSAVAANFSTQFVPGVYNLNGGTFDALNGLTVGDRRAAAFNMSGGTLHLHTGVLGVGNAATATFTQTGGAVQVDGFARIGRTTDTGTGNGAYHLSGATSTLTVAQGEQIGVDSNPVTGSFTQLAGTHTVGGILAIGQFGSGTGTASGSYTLAGGVLNTGALAIGGAFSATADATGTFTQTGGTHTVGSPLAPGFFELGGHKGTGTGATVGTYTLSNAGSSFTVHGKAYVGGDFNNLGGKGVVNVQGGAMTVTERLQIWDNADSSVNLSGGTLSVGQLLVTDLGQFNWTGGTLEITAQNAVLGDPVGIGQAVNFAPGKNLRITGVSRYLELWPSAVLTFSGGHLDLTDKQMIAVGGNVGSFDGTSYSGLSGLIAAGKGPEGAWNGSGIITTMPAAQDGGLTTLGIGTADELGLVEQLWAGEVMDTGDVLVMYTWAGDANLDGFVDGGDYAYIDAYVGSTGANVSYTHGDFNYDGAIDGGDYAYIDVTVGSAPFDTGSRAGRGATALSAVPEPASAAGLAMLGAALLGRRRRKRRAGH